MKGEIAKTSTKDCTDQPRRWTGDKPVCFVLPGDLSAPLMRKQSHCCYSCFLAAVQQPQYQWHRQPGWSGGVEVYWRRQQSHPSQFAPSVSPWLTPKRSLLNPRRLHVAVAQICPLGCSAMTLAGAFMLTVPEELTLCVRYNLNAEVWLSQGSASHTSRLLTVQVPFQTNESLISLGKQILLLQKVKLAFILLLAMQVLIIVQYPRQVIHVKRWGKWLFLLMCCHRNIQPFCS